MKKSFNVNLGGVIFRFDEDALELLERYITKVGDYFKDKGEELKVTETEENIAAKLKTRVGVENIVTIELLRGVLDDIGLPFGAVDCEPAREEKKENSSNESETASNASSGTDDAPWRAAMLLGKKLFREPYNQILGGVLAGVAKYSGWSIALTRVLFFLFFLVSCSIGGGGFLLLLAYCISWVLIPKARSVIDLTRMRKPASMEYSASGFETAWKTNYDVAMAELSAPKTNGCLSGGIRIIFFMLLFMLLIPMLFVLAVMLFAFGVLLFVLFSTLGAAIFENVYVVILFILPLIAFVHWVLKKCGVCRPLNIYIKLAIIIGWFVTLALAGYKIYTVVDENGGWEKIQQQIVDKRFFDEDFWREIIKENLERAQSEGYVAWDDDNLPFVIDAKIYTGYNNDDRICLRFIDRNDWRGSGNTEYHYFDASSMDVYLWGDSVGDIRLVWDSIANEVLVSMDATLGASMHIESSADGVQLRYLTLSDSVQYGNAMDYGKVPLEMKFIRNAIPELTVYGNDSIDGIPVKPVSTRLSIKKNFNVRIDDDNDDDGDAHYEIIIEPSDTL